MSWLQKWEEGRENLFSQNDLGLKGRRMSRESWNEVRELVKEGESMYKVRVEGGNENEMVLEWNGIPLVRVSAWIYKTLQWLCDENEEIEEIQFIKCSENQGGKYLEEELLWKLQADDDLGFK
ncbi:unnamed protein product [Lactuca virosa]|uniref:Uncharacterized protein n=1 Tax=Lactuca virosa TaxID=75947 RepID=A0AAU9P7C6_9ASTR|nr:unnamed protein product [Lactuca virosa]